MKPKTIGNLQKAVAKLLQFTSQKNPSELERAGVIQAFEFTYELMWKAFKEIAEGDGLSAPSPKSACKAAFQLGLITEESVWLEIIKDRNLTCHTYNETLAQEIYLRIRDRYVAAMQATLHNFLQRRT